MDAVKIAFLAFLNALKLWGVGLWNEAVKLVLDVKGRVVGIAVSVMQAVEHVVMIPAHLIQWVAGCVRASWSALASVWRR